MTKQNLKESKISCQPKFLTFSGAFSGLSIFTKKIETENNFLKDGQIFLPAVSVLVSTAYEYPEAGSGTLLETLPGESLQIEVKPVMLQSDEKLGRILLKERQCMLQAESDALLTQNYSLNSCYLTCRNNFIIKMCRCQPYFFYNPRIRVPLCKLSQLFCITKYAGALQKKAPSVFSFKKPKIKDYPDCYCQAGCEGTWYDIGIKRLNIKHILGRNVTGLVDIHYAKYGAIKYKRKLSFSSENLID